MDIKPDRFKAEWLSKADIGKVVETVRSANPICQKLPIDILGFAEHDLGLEFDFAPIRHLGQDAFLRPDLTGIVFDNSTFVGDNLPRLRFSVAHELGHFYLHKAIYGKLHFGNVKQWLDFIDAIPYSEYQHIEWQADEFAGQLLMPINSIRKALDEAVDAAAKEGYLPLGEDAVLEFCCKAIHADFGVSRQATATRLKRADLWPHPKVPSQ